jgi:hypothetical protein
MALDAPDGQNGKHLPHHLALPGPLRRARAATARSTLVSGDSARTLRGSDIAVGLPPYEATDTP